VAPCGVVVVDKPAGITSFDVVARVRRALGERRVGHAGTLDPMATGVLPVCVGEATKLVPFLMGGDKEYEAQACLGVTTDTLDSTGTVLAETGAGHVTRADVEALLPRFTGRILQVPPMHSALKVDGKRLYELARQGVEVEREARSIEIHALALTEWAPPRLGLRVHCGKGTYIRSLIDDLGRALAVGAHMTALARTRVGPFALARALDLGTLGPETPLLGLAEALADLATLALDAAQTRDVRAGKVRAVAALEAPANAGPHVRLLGPDGALVAVAAAAEGRLTLERVFC
jgi:tRNA pseudouridine55 synthase